MTKRGISWLAIELTRREGKKKQVNVAQMREILACLADIIYCNRTLLPALWTYARKRANDKGRKR